MVGIGGGGRGVANTRDAIVAAARREFLSKGFHEASLRSIASEAGVTTGAIYGYFSSKEALLGAAVGNVGGGLCELCQQAFVEFESRSIEERSFSNMGAYEEHVQLRIIDYIYDHHDEFSLIAQHPVATRWERDLDCLVELEVRSTRAYGSSCARRAGAYETQTPSCWRSLRVSFFKRSSNPSCGVWGERRRAPSLWSTVASTMRGPVR